MTFEALALAFIALLTAGIAARMLASGRAATPSGPADRAAAPAAYWLRVLVFASIAGLTAWRLVRELSLPAERTFDAALLVGPFCLYLAVEALRCGEVVFGNNRFPRSSRTQPYWTILILLLIFAAFFIGTILYYEAHRTAA
jgi:hypothetical protein